MWKFGDRRNKMQRWYLRIFNSNYFCTNTFFLCNNISKKFVDCFRTCLLKQNIMFSYYVYLETYSLNFSCICRSKRAKRTGWRIWSRKSRRSSCQLELERRKSPVCVSRETHFKAPLRNQLHQSKFHNLIVVSKTTGSGDNMSDNVQNENRRLSAHFLWWPRERVPFWPTTSWVKKCKNPTLSDFRQNFKAPCWIFRWPTTRSRSVRNFRKPDLQSEPFFYCFISKCFGN